MLFRSRCIDILDDKLYGTSRQLSKAKIFE
jgi:hypothetical protein